MKLFHAHTTCSFFPLVVLHELGTPFDVVHVDLRTKKTDSGDDFLTVNPKGKVPALALDDGQVLTEGPAIALYLAEGSPQQRLVPPAGTPARARLYECLNFLTSDLHKSFGVFFQPTATEAHVQAVRGVIAQQLAYLDASLAGRPFLLGDEFSIADAYLFTILGWTSIRRIDVGGLQHLAAFQERVAARPAVSAAMVHERRGRAA